jgi:uncharacterized protein (TIGR02679 family)
VPKPGGAALDDDGAEGDDDTPAANAFEGPRALWAAQGVTANELARPALSLNLPLCSQGPDGEPRYGSLRQLLRAPTAWQAAGRRVFVCENPNLLALAADALGPRCAPLACIDGMPATAQRTLLQRLVAAGACLRYHGDFDGPGIAIANRVLQDFGAVPWRVSGTDYAAAVALATPGQPAPLEGRPVAALWDDALAARMGDLGAAVAEEATFDLLLPDLSVP